MLAHAFFISLVSSFVLVSHETSSPSGLFTYVFELAHMALNSFASGQRHYQASIFYPYQGVISQAAETSGVERTSCDARVWVLPKRQNKMTEIMLDRHRDYPAKVSHYPVAFICCKQQRRNKLFFSHVRFLFCSIFRPRTNICIQYSSTFVTCIKIS